MDGWMDWIMLSRGLKPRCRSEYLGQLDWSDFGSWMTDGHYGSNVTQAVVDGLMDG
jgi:hypothetical protein